MAQLHSLILHSFESNHFFYVRSIIEKKFKDFENNLQSYKQAPSNFEKQYNLPRNLHKQTKEALSKLIKDISKRRIRKEKTQTEIQEEAANQAEEKGMFEEEEEDDDSNTSQYSEVPPS